MIISRQHEFSAGHSLSGCAGKCRNLHGHNYTAQFFMDGAIGTDGMVVDFGDIKNGPCKWLDDNWDHRFLVWDRDPAYGDLKKIDPTVVGVPFNPTAEEMARFLMDVVCPRYEHTNARFAKVAVMETGNCTAVAYRSDRGVRHG
jgi:6-pyruvoyltetrahydropterin/6-carboxytetrahydropterin synthase